MNEQLVPFHVFSSPDYDCYIDNGKQSIETWSDLQRVQVIRND